MNKIPDKARKAAAVAAMAELFGRELTDAAIDMYVQALDDLAASRVEAAAIQAARTCKYMPTVAELREAIGERGGHVPAIEAWRIVSDAVASVGSYRDVDFGPITNAAIRSLGGWARICALPEPEFDKWLRRDFISAYECYSRRLPSIEACQPLSGLSTGSDVVHTDKRITHHPLPPPMLVGVETPTPRITKEKREGVPMIALRKP